MILRLVVFLSGAVLLALEIVASRVVAPFLGNSVYVWGALIGVFLGALAVGYFLGGLVADRTASAAVFAGLVFLAGALLVPIPLTAPGVLGTIALSAVGPRTAPLLAAVTLFFLPAVVIGALSPFAVRLHARTVATIGNVAGGLYALNTVGSILGTLLAAFVLLSWMSVPVIIYLLGGTMMLLAVPTWLAAGRGAAAAVAGAVALLLLAGVPMAGRQQSPPGRRFQRDTVYHRITVDDEAGVRYLRLDAYWQSGMDLTDPRRTVFAYSDYLHLPLLFRPEASRVLFVGLGGGTAPRRYHEDYPRMRIDVVEIDPAVIAAARRYFGVPQDLRMRLVAQDGRLFVARSSERYDIIVLDAYLIDTIPFHLATREFFQTVRAHLTPGGVLASNVIGALEGPRSGFFRAVYRTSREVFPAVYVFPTDWGRYGGRDSLRNIIIVGSTSPPRSPEAVRAAARTAQARAGVTIPRFLEAAADLYTEPIPVEDVPTLTDDYAPVEILLRPR
ncbi:MAG: fused MFS/spermidine synthase [Armatimonadota bacterium]|nr:fused MFS/spermidine synthase [Armatimonadota bacterium]MDR7450944.1 fused MFS/spermidine synthase [Armatimonadota bacterium]MDR7465866.1 fused MFS/spermidine synthase [Armatimonadota bacterium]MDR7493774.1 fused MFS/spermidine synthase [Armatimonadota bacterium]MDR7498380.1 fused MFS/spermidine synthase [Armatimonadota bacterium]